MDGRERFLNRELSWLAFNRRVLALAEDEALPLLERVRFLGIASRNLDEFFQVRVAGLQDQELAGVGAVSPDGRTPTEQLRDIREAVLELTGRAELLFGEKLRPALADAGIAICSWPQLGEAERGELTGLFERHVFPILTPLGVDPTHPFPHISDLSLNLAVLVRGRAEEPRFVRLKVPGGLPRFLALEGGARFVPVEQVVEAHLDRLLPGAELLASGLFRVTRDADLELRESRSVDLLQAIESSLRQRVRSSDAVRLEVSEGLPQSTVERLRDELELDDRDVYRCSGPLGLDDLLALADLDRPELKLPPWPPVRARLAAEDVDGDAGIFARLRREDVLVHHPYESFAETVEAFLRQAAVDPRVRAIKMTLYRTGSLESEILRSLARAAQEGKQVAVAVELKARFEEEANVERARHLEQSGAHVVYGLPDLKTHAKLAFVAREEEGRVRGFVHLGTGNYNPSTARSYEDLGLFSADPEIAADAADLFNALTSGSPRQRYRKLLVAPWTLRSGLLEEIRREMEAPDGRIAIKVNAVADAGMIDALYAASQAGVAVDLAVRGICCLRPGVPGLSDNVRVRGILGRYLEHSRIYRFGSRARGFRYLLGSADLMPRNLDLRVETLVPVSAPGLCARLDEILDLCLSPDADVWELDAGGRWSRRRGRVDVQARLRALALERAAAGPAGG